MKILLPRPGPFRFVRVPNSQLYKRVERNPVAAYDSRHGLARDQRDDAFEAGQAHEAARARLEEALTALQKFLNEAVTGERLAMGQRLVESLLEAAVSSAGAEDEDAPEDRDQLRRPSDKDQPPFPGRPLPGGGKDPLRAMDTRSVQMAMDAARSKRERDLIWSRRSRSTAETNRFNEMFPGAADIKTV
jgi:hypothetical protein